MKWNKISTSSINGCFVGIYELKEEGKYPTVFRAELTEAEQNELRVELAAA